MRRKIVKLGPATLVASLPSKWAKQFNLKAGDELDVDEKGNTLIVTTKKEIKGKDVKFHVPSKDKFMGRYIHTPYRFGVDKLVLTFDNINVMPKIQHYLEELLGFEITNQTEKSVTIEMVAKGMDEEFDKILRRSFLLLLTMIKELPEAAKAQNKEKLDELAALERMLNKLTNFLERMLNKRGYEDSTKTTFLFVLAWTFEQLADDVREICLLSKTGKISPVVISFMNKFYSYYRLFYENYYDRKEGNLLKLRNQFWSMKKEILNLLSKSKTANEKQMLAYLLAALDKVNHLNISLV